MVESDWEEVGGGAGSDLLSGPPGDHLSVSVSVSVRLPEGGPGPGTLDVVQPAHTAQHGQILQAGGSDGTGRPSDRNKDRI